MNFELNLVPFVDVLSTCICFLLITVVSLELGTLNVRQAIGDAAQTERDEKPALWLKFEDNGGIHLTVKNVKRSRASEFLVRAGGASPDFHQVEQSLKVVKQTYPELDTALILPAASSKYADLIRVMDVVKRGQIQQVGIAPL